jgi:hypothetical protein
VADNDNAPPLPFQFDDHRPDALYHVHVALARRPRVAVVQLIGAALGVLLRVPRLLLCGKVRVETEYIQYRG